MPASLGIGITKATDFGDAVNSSTVMLRWCIVSPRGSCSAKARSGGSPNRTTSANSGVAHNAIFSLRRPAVVCAVHRSAARSPTIPPPRLNIGTPQINRPKSFQPSRKGPIKTRKSATVIKLPAIAPPKDNDIRAKVGAIFRKPR